MLMPSIGDCSASLSGVLSSRLQRPQARCYRSDSTSSSLVISLVRPRRRLSLAPTAGMLTPSRRQGVSRLAALAATVRLGLDTTEHDGTLGRSGLLFPFFGLLQYWTLPAVFAVEAPKASETMVRRRLRPLLCPERDQQMTRGSPRPRPPPNRRCLAAKGRGAVN